MKLHLPLLLLAALSAQAVAESISVALDHDTTLQGSQYQETAIEGEYALAYRGQGLYSLDFTQVDPVQGDGTIIRLKSTDSSSLSLAFSDLTRLTFSGKGVDMPAQWSGPVNLNNLGDARFAVENISGDVSFSDFSGGSISQSPVHVWSQDTAGGTEASIRIADIDGKLRINNNTSTGRGDLFVSMGMLARVSPRGEGVSNALIELSGIGNGVEITGNTREGSAGFAGLIATVNTGLGLSSITVSDIRGGMRVTDNQSSDYGVFSCLAGSTQAVHGLITGEAVMSITGVQGDILFQNNSAYASGGLTLVGCQCSLDISGIDGNVYFIGNSSSVGAGAIYCAPDPKDDDPQRSNVTLSADGGDIVFQGNRNTGENIANAMIVGANTDVRLNASEGRTIAFYDPVVIDDAGRASTVHLNEGSATGKILFSGELYAESGNADNYTSFWDADVIQYNGVVQLKEKGAVEAASYTQKDGVLVMGSGASLTTVGDLGLKQLIIDLGGRRETVSLTCGGQLSLTGTLQLAGNSDLFQSATPIFEARAHDLAQMPSSVTFTQDGVVYVGAVRKQFDDNENMWKVTLASGDMRPERVIPELSGAGVANAMLSSASNVRTLGSSTLGRLNAAHWRPSGRGIWWVDGLGDFAMHRSEAGREGFDYQGGGYALGGAYRVSPDWLVGGAFGQMIGKNTGRDYASVNRQNTLMGMLGAVWKHRAGERSEATVSAAVGYGSTENELKSSYAGGQASRGDWNNRAFTGELKGAWHIELAKDCVLSPWVSLEYTDVLQNAFTETGDMARRFDKGRYRNLAVPVGVSLAKTCRLQGGQIWENAVSVSYVPDVYRKQPATSARKGDYTWKASGSEPARNAVRAGVTSRFSWNASWDVTCAYQVEVRSEAVYQTCSVGLGYSF